MMSNQQPVITARVPHPVRDALWNYAEERAIAPSHIIGVAVAEWLKRHGALPDNGSTNLERA